MKLSRGMHWGSLWSICSNSRITIWDWASAILHSACVKDRCRGGGCWSVSQPILLIIFVWCFSDYNVRTKSRRNAKKKGSIGSNGFLLSMTTLQCRESLERHIGVNKPVISTLRCACMMCSVSCRWWIIDSFLARVTVADMAAPQYKLVRQWLPCQPC